MSKSTLTDENLIENLSFSQISDVMRKFKFSDIEIQKFKGKLTLKLLIISKIVFLIRLLTDSTVFC